MLALLEEEPKTWDDYFVQIKRSSGPGEGSDKSECTWEDARAPKWRNSTRGIRKENCRVVEKVDKPWPSTVRGRRAMREWITNNRKEWNDYRKKRSDAWKNAKSYWPYIRANCTAIKG